MKAIEKLAREHLPDNIGTEWSGLSFQEKKAEGQTGMVMSLVFIFVFLFLAALYESWFVPIAVLLSLPIAALGAYLGVWVFGLENDVYFQIGLVTLIGLAAKNAILIVEFAKVEVDKGVDAVQAAITAARARFRPILMTSLAFVLGMLPMVLATGPGSASRHSIGTGIFFGMIVAISGESQRVALGRAILAAESLLIMDEPLASLDAARKTELLGYFERIPEITGIPVLYITHAADEAERLARTVLRMKDGRITDVLSVRSRPS